MLNLIAIWFNYGTAEKQQYSDSEVMPELNQIQNLLMPCNNSPPNSLWERNPAKIFI